MSAAVSAVVPGHRRLWVLFGLTVFAAFFILGFFGREVYRQAPPIPAEVRTTGEQYFDRPELRIVARGEHGRILGQRSFRGVYAGLFLGQTSLVFAGLQCTSEVGLTGGLALWVSGGLALTGLGLTVWALEARRGRMNLDVYHGGYERSPMLATCFLLFGLTSCGFPGTLGFISEELLLEGTTHAHPHVGILAAVAASINGITVMRTYFRLFCGSRQQHPVSQSMRPRERAALLALVVLLLGFGLWPQPFVDNRAEFAKTVLHERHQLLKR